MERVVYKYKMEEACDTVIMMPWGAEILCAQLQFGTPTLWALVDPNQPPQERVFEVLGTGQAMEDNIKRKYIGTFQMNSGVFVFHIFEKLKS